MELGISQGASENEIKKSFRAKAMRIHPDLNEGADCHEAFLRLKSAYDFLCSHKTEEFSDKRENYRPYEDDKFFYQGGYSVGGNRIVDIEVPLQTIYSGGIVNTIDSSEICLECRGTGNPSQNFEFACNLCNGTGNIKIVRGIIRMASTCPQCNGDRWIKQGTCIKCNGKGFRGEKMVSVKIEPGIPEGTEIRIKEAGFNGQGGAPAGDLIVVARSGKHDLFERSGADLSTTLYVSFMDMCLGGKAKITPLGRDSPIMLTIPRGFQAGSVLKIKDHGLPIYKSDQEHEAYGHLFVKIMPKIPRHLSEEQEKILVSVKNLF